MTEYKRPSGSRPAYDNNRALWDLVKDLERRVTVIDGNGNPMAEGGFIGRMKKQHEANQRMLKWLIGLLLAANVGIWGDLLKKIVK